MIEHCFKTLYCLWMPDVPFTKHTLMCLVVNVLIIYLRSDSTMGQSTKIFVHSFNKMETQDVFWGAEFSLPASTHRLFKTSTGWQKNREPVSGGEQRKVELDVCWVEYHVCAVRGITVIWEIPNTCYPNKAWTQFSSMPDSYFIFPAQSLTSQLAQCTMLVILMLPCAGSPWSLRGRRWYVPPSRWQPQQWDGQTGCPIWSQLLRPSCWPSGWGCGQSRRGRRPECSNSRDTGENNSHMSC